MPTLISLLVSRAARLVGVGDLIGGAARRRRATAGRDPLGPAAERAAARMLRRRGYRVLGRNVRVAVGEADLVCLAPDRRTVVVVEVKCRRVTREATGETGRSPEAAVGARKKRKLLAVMDRLARANGWDRRPLRIDVVAVEWPARGKPVLRHHENAVTLDDWR